MNEHLPEEPNLVGLSKVKLIRNTRMVCWEITAVEGADEAELERLRNLVTAQHHALEASFPEGP